MFYSIKVTFLREEALSHWHLFLNLMTLRYRSPRRFASGVSALWVDDRMRGFVFSLSKYFIRKFRFAKLCNNELNKRKGEKL